MLKSSEDVKKIWWGVWTFWVHELYSRLYIIHHTIGYPVLASQISAKLKPVECQAIDVPILGDIDSNNANLTILAGGDQEAFRLCELLLKVYVHCCELMGGPESDKVIGLTSWLASASLWFSVIRPDLILSSWWAYSKWVWTSHARERFPQLLLLRIKLAIIREGPG